MLLGTLARINTIITPLMREEEVVVPVVAPKQSSTIDEDFGVPISRETQEKTEVKLEGSKAGKGVGMESETKEEKLEKRSRKVAKSDSSSRVEEKTSSKPPKKKRKKGNAIDDIFGSIL